MSIFRDFFIKEKPVFTGITRGIGGFGFGLTAAGGGGGTGPLSLSGGTKIPAATSGDGYTYHVFTGTDTWENDSGNNGVVDILLVAGGASGGLSGGGGGAGGVAFGNSFPIGGSDGPYTITVGSGGAATPHPSPDQRGRDGSDTTFNFNGGSYVARRGGAGGKGNSGAGPTQNGSPGGSGGGVGRDNAPASAGTVFSPQPSSPFFTRYGNAGGTGTNTGGNSGGGGGGGASEAGKNNKPSANGGDGGHGILIPAFPAPVIAPTIPAPNRTNFTNAVRHYGAYGGGGGGGGYSYGGSSGGNGGGGWGDAGDLGGGGPSVAQQGADYTGGGGGGSGGINSGVTGNSGKGGDGLCVIRYTENTTKATGGFVSYIGSKTVHAFTRNCGMTQFTNPTALTVDVVAVGGGGSGGTVSTSASSGGGAGGVYYRTGYSLPAAAHNISIGAGGDQGSGGSTTMSPGSIAASATGGPAGSASVGSGANSGGYPSNGNAASGPYLFSKGSGSSSSGNASGGGGGAESNGINAGGDCGSYAGGGGGGKPFTNVATIEIKLGSGGGGGNRCAPGGTNTAGAGGDNATPSPTVGGWNISTWNRNQGGPGASENYSAGATQGPQSNAIAGLSRVGNYGLPGTGSGGGGTHQYTNESTAGGRGGDGILYVLYDT